MAPKAIRNTIDMTKLSPATLLSLGAALSVLPTIKQAPRASRTAFQRVLVRATIPLSHRQPRVYLLAAIRICPKNHMNLMRAEPALAHRAGTSGYADESEKIRSPLCLSHGISTDTRPDPGID